jgi:hypothetical protein
MKAALALLLNLLAFSVFAQWTPSGSNIQNTNTGDVLVGSSTSFSSLRVYGRFFSYKSKSNDALDGEFFGTSAWWGLRTDTNNSFHLDVYNNNSPKSALSVNQEGNVGIGTTTPGSRLEIKNTAGSQLKLSGGAVAGGVWTNTGDILYLADWNTGEKGLAVNMTSGNVGIGTWNPGSFKLAVDGKIGGREIHCKVGSWADYVFEKDYKLPSLAELQQYIEQNKHLPEIPTEAEVAENGVNLGEMNRLLLKKVEELTLYMIEQNKEMNAYQEKMLQLEQRSMIQQKEIEKLKKK